MKAIIKSAEFVKEFESKFGMLYQHRIKYDEKTAYYSSKKKEQTYFIPGKEAEFTEEIKESKNGKYTTIKPVNSFAGNSNFTRALKKEQSKYSGFAMSYAKDLVIADKIKLDQISDYTKKMFTLMVELDRTLEL